MKAIVLMFDSLNRHMLPPYGCDWTHAPNFSRLAERTVTFDTSYVCSMPCMPARRDFLTGRPNFLHRSWGPLEPFDDSLPRLLRAGGVTSHLVTDHYHYFECGGATYHTQYDSWQFFRGQEGDPWIGWAGPPPAGRRSGRNASSSRLVRQDQVNRLFIREEHQWPQSQTVAAGIEFMRRNAREENWFLQIEVFDPHEPFFAHRMYKDRYPEHYARYDGPVNDWPFYGPVTESPEEIEHLRYEYASLLSMCDAKLGDVLDCMDELGLWEDTLFIVWTDHGFLLAEHGLWGKTVTPLYEEIARTPFFVWDPRCRKRGERRRSLVQPAIDLAPTILGFFGLAPTEAMFGRDLAACIAADEPVRDAAIFGYFGQQVNVTDGRRVYMRGPAGPGNGPLFEYTLMPTHMREMFSVEELQGTIELAEPFTFTKGCRTLRIPARVSPLPELPGGQSAILFDLERDPGQERGYRDPEEEAEMERHLVRLMRALDAPAEQYVRLGLDEPAPGAS